MKTISFTKHHIIVSPNDQCDHYYNDNHHFHQHILRWPYQEYRF